ncbi:MAG: hypothetical protein NKF70_10490 [Methanobacterium sp. ERen5]|nr:MAG: hypothetical protein NKF70_10490 [Methanobacterium sp. ERen5]
MSSSSCPRCGSKMMKIHNPNAPLWECSKCGYTGSVVIRDGNIEKQLKETKKLEKLSKKMLRGR